jgi:ABC-type uncharacterized transport system substrate-binding protein
LSLLKRQDKGIEKRKQGGCLGMRIAEKVMKNMSGVPVSQIPFEEGKTGAPVVNLKTARQVKIDIPCEILETGEKIYEQ